MYIGILIIIIIIITIITQSNRKNIFLLHIISIQSQEHKSIFKHRMIGCGYLSEGGGGGGLEYNSAVCLRWYTT